MVLGALLILAAAALLAYNKWDASRADKASQEVLGELEQTLNAAIEEKAKSDTVALQPELDPTQEMTCSGCTRPWPWRALPAPMALMTVAAPVTASPPAYTPSRLVLPSSPSVTMQPCLLVSRPGVVERISGLGLVPSHNDRIHVQLELAALFQWGGGGRKHPARPAPSRCR